MQRAAPIPVEVVKGTPDCFGTEVQSLGRLLTGFLESSYTTKQGAGCLQGKVQQGDRALLLYGKLGKVWKTSTLLPLVMSHASEGLLSAQVLLCLFVALHSAPH